MTRRSLYNTVIKRLLDIGDIIGVTGEPEGLSLCFNNNFTLQRQKQQIIINVVNPAIIPSLRKVLNAIDGISLVPQRRKSVIVEADEDSRLGCVYKADIVNDMFK